MQGVDSGPWWCKMAVPDQLKHWPIERMSQSAFDSLPEYSLSIPTLLSKGKVWKKDLGIIFPNLAGCWVICEVVELDGNKSKIESRFIEIMI